VAELARQYEAGGGISFRGFIDELRTAAELESAEAPILEESSDGVRLMTVHKAKGLEFRVVILADLTCRMSRSDASRHLDASRNLCAMKIGGWAPRELHDHEEEEVLRDEAEGVRLAYVAATRARDLLVVPALGDGEWDGGWFGPLNRALYPPLAARRAATRAPRCPAFKSKDSVLQRPGDEPAGPSTVCPGQHVFDGYSVVWWDPSALDLGRKPAFGVRREDLIVKDVARNVVADGRGRYDRWLLARADARDRGAAPSLRVHTVREAAELADFADLGIPDSPFTIVDLRARSDVDRAGGAGFGMLLHELLAQAPFNATREDLAALAAVQVRVLGLTGEEGGAAVDAAARVLKHELILRAADAERRGACRRETPVTFTTASGVLVEGVVDLAFEEGSTWTVVDYKSDRELMSLGEDRYRRQIVLYAAAIQQATGRPARGALVRV
jgi:hypothetical protein